MDKFWTPKNDKFWTPNNQDLDTQELVPSPMDAGLQVNILFSYT